MLRFREHVDTRFPEISYKLKQIELGQAAARKLTRISGSDQRFFVLLPLKWWMWCVRIQVLITFVMTGVKELGVRASVQWKPSASLRYHEVWRWWFPSDVCSQGGKSLVCTVMVRRADALSWRDCRKMSVLIFVTSKERRFGPALR